MWEEIGCISTSTQREGFLESIQILLNKPQVVNRRLCGAQTIWEGFVDSVVDVVTKVAEIESERILHLELLSNALLELRTEEESSSSGLQLLVRDLLPRQLKSYHIMRELFLLNECSLTAIFLPLCCFDTQSRTNALPYSFHLDTVQKRLSVRVLCLPAVASACDGGDNTPSLTCTRHWLTTTLLLKLARWGEAGPLNTTATTLRLVPVQRYSNKYQELKERYAPSLIKNWPEKTDPQKFVFEDVAITAYLLVLWEEERAQSGEERKQTFVDLGCGNGLLVHLLNSEGYSGVGIDVRKRKIWDLYGESTNLKEGTITPSDSHLFPECDWIIGNHSDELTPWIPVIAAKSSYHCRYFVLPCCMWDFDRKFQQKLCCSQYRSYLDFVCHVGEVCGFRVQEDALRIPSTKRICLIGQSRTYSEEAEPAQDAARQAYIRSRCGRGQVLSEEGEPPAEGWVKFRARPSTERVRNCSTVTRQVQEEMVATVFTLLLAEQRMKTLEDGRQWNQGGCCALTELVTEFDSDMLGHLKSECGGLQTLLRNHHHIFLVKEGGVRLRDWTRPEHHIHQREKQKKKGKPGDARSLVKTRLCYFHTHHSHGCPLPAEQCQFAHSSGELREMPPRL